MSLRRATYPRSWTARRWIGTFVASEATTAGSSLFLARGTAAALLHDVASLAAAVAVVAGIRRYRPPLLPWLLVALAVLLFGCGDVAYGVDAAGGSLKIFSVGDWLYLSAMIALAVALAWFGSRPRHSGWAGRMLVVDSAPLFLGAFLLLWFLVFNTKFDGSGLSVSSRTLIAAYPTLDLLLLALGARLLLTGASRLPSFGLLVAGISSGFLGDLIWRGFLQENSYANVWVNASYYVAYAFLGAAALHPSMRLLPWLKVDEARVLPARRLPLLGAALATVPLVVLLRQAEFTEADDLAIFGVAATLIPALVVYRLVDLASTARRLARTAEESAARLEAVLDASPLPIAVLGGAGEVERWNEAAEAVSGCRPRT
jgi:hypothetical protein